ncbi:hypothetical protein J6590_072981 [Homalodisca vitripennis]|nr:hypothetical protein J6590_072981 [Homalodisca vitripennis]
MTSGARSQSIPDTFKSRKSGYKNLLGSSKTDYINQETKGNKENEDVSKTPQTTKTVTEGVNSDSEISNKKKKPLRKSCLKKERKEKIGEDSINGGSSLKESPRRDLKEKCQCTVVVKHNVLKEYGLWLALAYKRLFLSTPG